MDFIHVQAVQTYLNEKLQKDIYLHLETTNGAYATHHEKKFASGAFIRNAKINYLTGKITGEGPYRVGLQLEVGWVYAEGLTHYEIDDLGRLLMAGFDYDGKLAVALELSETLFEK